MGGTKILGVLFDSSTGEVLDLCKDPTPLGNGALAAAVVRSIERLTDGRRPVGIGVGLPGLVDGGGVLRFGPNVPGVVGLDMSPVIENRFGLRPFVANDATLAALAEHHLGAGVGHDNLVLVTLGTGVGGGLVIGGRVVYGANGFAGEPGHMVIGLGRERCACGNRGCWEATASGSGLAGLAERWLVDNPDSPLGCGHRPLTGESVIEADREGDRDARAVLDLYSESLAVGIGSLINLVDPSMVILGGGLSEAGLHFLDQVRSGVPRWVLGGEFRPAVPVEVAQLGAAAGAIGAALACEGLDH